MERNEENLDWFSLLPYAGKFWRGKILANLAINANSPNQYLYNEINEDLPLDPPKFSAPFALTLVIRQNFKIFPCTVSRTL